MISSLLGFPLFLNFMFSIYAKLHLPFIPALCICKFKVFMSVRKRAKKSNKNRTEQAVYQTEQLVFYFYPYLCR